jgi:hypothetical protein
VGAFSGVTITRGGVKMNEFEVIGYVFLAVMAGIVGLLVKTTK